MLHWLKSIFKPWPKTFRFTVRNGDCQVLGVLTADLRSWNEVMDIGANYAQYIMSTIDDDNLDEVFWEYEEVK